MRVQEVAQLAGVSTAAVRARLEGGQLAGTKLLVGRREVWDVDPAAARQYAHSRVAGRSARPPAGSAGGGSAASEARTGSPGDPAVVARADQPVESAADGGGVGEPVWLAPEPSALTLAEVLRENARLRDALRAMSRAHRALVELVEVQAAAPR